MGDVPLWAARLRHVIRGGAAARLRDVSGGASAATQWAALVALADLALDDGTLPPACEPTAETLGRQLHLSAKGARRALQALTAAGLVTAVEARGRHTVYALAVDAIEPCETTPHRWNGRTPPTVGPLTQCPPSQRVPPPNVTREGGQDGRGTPPNVSRDPSQRVPPHPYRIDRVVEDSEESSTPSAALPAAPATAPLDTAPAAAAPEEPLAAPPASTTARRPPKPRRGQQGSLLDVGPGPTKAPRAYSYVDAFDLGQQEATSQPFVTPRSSASRDQITIAQAVRAHAPTLTGEAVISWIRETSAAWRRARPSQANYGGYTPAKLVEWLNNGRPGDRASGPVRQTGIVDGAAQEWD